jgi:cell division protein FtsL
MAVAFKLPIAQLPREDREQRPKLVLVGKSERRYYRVFTVMAALVVFMFCIVSLRAHMAQQEMRLDQLNYDITRARSHFETLRAERANLQSPGELMKQASTMGFVPSLGIQIVGIPASVAAEFGRMKSVVVGTP